MPAVLMAKHTRFEKLVKRTVAQIGVKYELFGSPQTVGWTGANTFCGLHRLELAS